MNFLRLLPVILSLLLLGAHFSRHNLGLLIVVPLVLLGLLFLREPWVARLVQWVLAFASLEWLRTAVVLALQRQQLGHLPHPQPRLSVWPLPQVEISLGHQVKV